MDQRAPLLCLMGPTASGKTDMAIALAEALSSWIDEELIEIKWPNDLLIGGDGVDTLRGGAGNDVLLGVKGNDVVLGQDGGSPGAAELAGHLDAVDAARPGVNVAYLVGHGTVRTESGVGFEDPGAEGLERMAARRLEAIDRALHLGHELLRVIHGIGTERSLVTTS